MSTQNRRLGVVLMTYGSATTAEHVAEYFTRIYKGKASPALIQDFENRYRAVGRSPLIEITEQQAARVQEKLGDEYVVRAGMRHSAPFISGAVADCIAAGATSMAGIVLSPQFSSVIMDGYKTAFADAVRASGLDAHRASVAGPWATESSFITLLAERVRRSLSELRAKYGASVPVIFTTHSLPLSVVEKDPSYLQQLQATIDAVRLQLDAPLEWYAAYQSAGHTPEEWLKPDLVDVLSALHEKKTPAVVIAPIQFLSDHLEVLYDLDIAAKKQCEERDVAYHRIRSANTDPLLIDALASVARRSRMDSD